MIKIKNEMNDKDKRNGDNRKPFNIPKITVWPPVIGYYLRRTLSIIEIHYFCT